jgi:hypothetical protein
VLKGSMARRLKRLANKYGGKFVSDGNAARRSNTAMMEMTTEI